MEYLLNGEELVLLLVSLIHKSHPEMLTEGEEGFVVDFGPVESLELPLAGDDSTLVKFRDALASEPADGNYRMEFEEIEASRLTELLAELEALEGLDPEVLLLSQALRTRLQASLNPI